MPMQVASKFSKWEFTEEEAPQAFTFSTLQELNIRTQIAEIVDRKIGEAVDRDDLTGRSIDRYLRAQEYYRGQIEALEYLLTMNDHYKEEALKQISASREDVEQPPQRPIFE